VSGTAALAAVAAYGILVDSPAHDEPDRYLKPAMAVRHVRHGPVRCTGLRNERGYLPQSVTSCIGRDNSSSMEYLLPGQPR
jgi:hypothetical protein